jgi:rhamnose transport system permease protein
MKQVALRPSDDDRDRAFAETQTILKVYPHVRLIITISAPAVPGSAEAVQQSGRQDVFVIGLSLPSLCKRYVHDGVMQAVVLWKTRDLGYLTVHTAALLVEGRMGKDSLEAARLGTIEVRGSQVILGKPFIFNKGNIDEYDF